MASMTAEEVGMIRFLRSNPVYAASLLFSGPDDKEEYPASERIFIRDMWNARLGLSVHGRGCHKTHQLGVLGALAACLKSDWKVVITSASFRQSKLVFQEIERKYNRSPYLQEATRKKPTQLPDMCYWELKNGSTVIALPLGDGGKIRGIRANTLLVDEVAQMPPEIIDQVLYATLAPASNPMLQVRLQRLKEHPERLAAADIDLFRVDAANQMVMASSAYYQFNHLYTKYQQFKSKTSPFLPDGSPNSDFDPMYKLFVYDYRDMPPGFMDMDMIEHAMGSMGVLDFIMEYCGYFPADSDGYYPASLVEAKCVDVAFSVKLAPDTGRRYVMGVDPARTHDFFAVSVLEEVSPGKWVQVYTFAERGLEHQVMRDIINGIATRFGVTYIAMDRGGGGLALMDLCKENGEGFVPPYKLKVPFRGYTVIEDDPNRPKGLARDPRQILDMVAFSPESIREMNTSLKAGLETGKMTFAGSASPMASGGISMDALESVLEEIKECRRELCTIQLSVTGGGHLHFDTPGNQPKDRAVSTWLAYYAARKVTEVSQQNHIILPSGVVGSGIPWR